MHPTIRAEALANAALSAAARAAAAADEAADALVASVNDGVESTYNAIASRRAAELREVARLIRNHLGVVNASSWRN